MTTQVVGAVASAGSVADWHKHVSWRFASGGRGARGVPRGAWEERDWMGSQQIPSLIFGGGIYCMTLLLQALYGNEAVLLYASVLRVMVSWNITTSL